MPVYDNNGTASTQIGKVYDNNGTTSTQIGKVYDNNGTTSSLIYTADYHIVTASNEYTGGWVAADGSYAHGGSIQQSGAELLQYTVPTVFGSYAGAGNARSAALIDLTGFSTLYFTVRDFYYAQYGRVGLSKTAQSGSAASGNSDYFANNGAVWKTSRFTPFTAAGTYSIDVSDLSGGCYIYLGLIAVANSSNGQGHVYYSNMYLV